MRLDLEKIYMQFAGITLFRNVLKDEVLENFGLFLSCALDENVQKYDKIAAYSKFVQSVYEHGGDFGKHILQAIECDDNAYVRGCATGKNIPGVMTEAFKSELKFFAELTCVSATELITASQLPATLAHFENTRINFSECIPERISKSAKYGYGMYAKYGMFRVDETGKLIPVLSPDKVEISQLVGYTDERKQVIDNTRALVYGKPAANVLLCGDAGTGKSSTVKAVANMFKQDGVRLIELCKNQLSLIPEVMGEIAENPLKFIIFVDDLSFACDDDGFGTLKAALEGSASAKASNAVIYATSNRRHLVKETFSARQGDDVHRNDTMQELMSLSERFGLTVLFSKPSKALYLQIASELVKKNGITMDAKELELKAEAFALAKGGRSARAAEQFADSLLI